MVRRNPEIARLRRAWTGALSLAGMAILALSCAASAQAEVTGASENLRTGWYPDEPALTHELLQGGGFQQAFKDNLQGQIYAQPLVADGTLLVATEMNWVYGLNPNTGSQLWARQFGTPVNAGEKGIECADLSPYIGITGTPVIDTTSNVAYFASNSYIDSKEIPGKIAWYMNAIELASGKELANFPVQIAGTARNLPGEVEFIPTQELQRPALLMMNGVVYAGFGSHCDKTPYEGWVVGVSSSGELRTMWATSKLGGSIWQSGSGLISDRPGQILFTTGNEAGGLVAGEGDPPPGFGTEPPEGRFGESVLRVEVQPGGELKPTDFFSPADNALLDEHDLDLGSSAPIALPSRYFGTPSVPDLLVQGGKEGYVYLLNRDNLGGMGQGPLSTENDLVVQKLGSYGAVWDGDAVWPGDGGYVCIPSVAPERSDSGSSNYMRFFKYGEEAGEPRLSLAAESPESEPFWFGSGSPIVTSDGASNGTGVLWITRCPTTGCGNAQLVAYNPVPLGKRSLQTLWSAPIGVATKFSRPLAANGHVYVGNFEGQLFGFSGPQLTPSSESLNLGKAPVGAQLTGQVTFTNTGSSRLDVSTVRAPSPPFTAGLPAPSTAIEPGHAIVVRVAFTPTEAGGFTGSLGLTTQAGETTLVLSGAATPAGEPTPTSGAGGSAPVTLTTPNVPGTLASTVEPPVLLTALRIGSIPARRGGARHELRLTYTLSRASTVEVTAARRVVSRRCRAGGATCIHYLPIRLRLRVAANAGSNTLVVNLARLPAGYYRLAIVPLPRTGVSGVARYGRFRVVR
jgi:outer membrane protein assembly factor BamB